MSYSAVFLQGTKAEWQNVFYLCAGILAGGLVLFLFLASGETQNWAMDEVPVTMDVLLDQATTRDKGSEEEGTIGENVGLRGTNLKGDEVNGNAV